MVFIGLFDGTIIVNLSLIFVNFCVIWMILKLVKIIVFINNFYHSTPYVWWELTGAYVMIIVEEKWKNYIS